MDKTRKKYIVLVIVTIVISVIALIGASYALLTMTIEGEKKVSLTAGILKVDFAEGDNINLDNVAPMTDVQGQKTTPYTFTITNTGNINAYYHVSLEEDVNNTLNNSYLKMRLTSDNGYDSGVVKVSSYGSGSFDITSEATLKPSDKVTYQLWMWLDYNADNSAQGKLYQSKIVVTSYDREQKTAVDTLLAKVNPENLDYNNATDEQKKEMWTFSHPETEQTPVLTDYRYIGKDPNNYVMFNNETWRIIGVFTVDDGTGKKEERLKIIRDESIGSYSWDNKDTTTGAEMDGGKNNWTDARLNYLLNPDHESNSIGGSLYWNSGSGTCYSGPHNTTISCVFTNTGLKREAQNMIGDSLWYLGGTDEFSSESDGLTKHFYSYERGTYVYGVRDTSWLGKVGLMYPSDYGYATSGGDTYNRDYCLNSSILFIWDADCFNNNWLYDASVREQYTMTPYGYDNTFLLYGEGAGLVSPYSSHGSETYTEVKPVVFLKSNIKIVDGDGSSSNPYILKN